MSRPREKVDHGTIKGYRQELRRGLRTCSSCRLAWRRYCAKYVATHIAKNRAKAEEHRLAIIEGVDQTTPEDVIARTFTEPHTRHDG